MTLRQFFCQHQWPRYFRHTGFTSVDYHHVHHLHLARECMKCGVRQAASLHVPQHYVKALDAVNAIMAHDNQTNLDERVPGYDDYEAVVGEARMASQ